MRKEDYIRILDENIKESAEKLQLSHECKYQQDYDPKLTVKLGKKWFKDNNVNVLKWTN